MTAVAALAQHDALAGLIEVDQEGLLVLGDDLGTDGDLDDDVRGAGARAVAAGAVAAFWRAEVLGVAEVDQGVEVVGGDEDDVPAAAAIAAVGAAELHELLTAEGDGSVAAVAGADVDLGLVEELHGLGSKEKGPARADPLRMTRRMAVIRSDGVERLDRDVDAAFGLAGEDDVSIRQGEDGVVLAEADVEAGLHPWCRAGG